jgi:hypothetical protein
MEARAECTRGENSMQKDIALVDAGRTTVKGLIADANIQGQVEYLVQRMHTGAWAEFWQAIGLSAAPRPSSPSPGMGS